MKLEFLDLTDGGKYPDVPREKLVRLYSYTDAEKLNLKDAIKDLILNRNKPLLLHELPYINALNCKVTLILADVDDGLVICSPSNEFICRLSSSEYENMAERMELTDGHIWLYGDGDERISFLLSPGLGGW